MKTTLRGFLVLVAFAATAVLGSPPDSARTTSAAAAARGDSSAIGATMAVPAPVVPPAKGDRGVADSAGASKGAPGMIAGGGSSAGRGASGGGGVAASAPAVAKAGGSSSDSGRAGARSSGARGGKSSATKVRIAVIPIHGEIDNGLRFFVKRGIEDALAANPRPEWLVFDIDTWGGELQAAFEISDLISNVKQCSTAAFVSKKAISAGALIGLSAQRLYMAPGTTIGDCAPIIQTGEGPQFVGEKVESPLRARFRALARRNGYPVLLSEKMVTRDMEVVGATRDGKRIYFTKQNYEELPDTAKAQLTEVRTAIEDGQLLTIDDVEAKEFGFSRGTFASRDSLLAAHSWEAGSVFEPNWSEDLVRWLSRVAPILLVVGLGALYLEIKTPGFGLFGLVGIIALGLVFGSQFLIGLADYTELLLFGLGLLLVGIEIFIWPGIAVFGLAGIVLIFGALLLSLQDFVLPDPSLPWEAKAFQYNLLLVLGTAIGGFVVSFLGLRYLVPHLPGRSGGPYLSETMEGARVRDADELRAAESALVGRIGIVTRPLRPTGKVEIDGEEFEAASRGPLVPAGRRVSVLAVRPNDLLVQEVAEPPAWQTPGTGDAGPGGGQGLPPQDSTPASPGGLA